MKTTGTQQRIKPQYTQKVEVPQAFRKFLWDHPTGKAPLEKVINRLLVHATFENIRWLMKYYPEATFRVTQKYPDVPRGAKFWVKTLYDND